MGHVPNVNPLGCTILRKDIRKLFKRKGAN